MRALLVALVLLSCSKSEEEPLSVYVITPNGGLVQVRTDLACAKGVDSGHPRRTGTTGYSAYCRRSW